MTVAAIYYFEVWNKDLTQEYTRKDNLSRDVYMKFTLEFQLPPEHYLKVLNPLYGLSESGDLLFNKYYFILKKVLLKQTDGGIAFYYIYKEHLQGMLAVYVDDTITSGNKPFKTLADQIPQTFESNPRDVSIPHFYSTV